MALVVREDKEKKIQYRKIEGMIDPKHVENWKKSLFSLTCKKQMRSWLTVAKHIARLVRMQILSLT